MTLTHSLRTTNLCVPRPPNPQRFHLHVRAGHGVRWDDTGAVIDIVLKRVQYPDLAFGAAWDQRKQNSEMVLMEDLLVRLGEYT